MPYRGVGAVVLGKNPKINRLIVDTVLFTYHIWRFESKRPWRSKQLRSITTLYLYRVEKSIMTYVNGVSKLIWTQISENHQTANFVKATEPKILMLEGTFFGTVTVKLTRKIGQHYAKQQSSASRRRNLIEILTKKGV